MNEPCYCVSGDIFITWNISLLINHVLSRSNTTKTLKPLVVYYLYGRGGGEGGHFVEGIIIKILIGFADHCRKGVR